jgi:tRNA1Val (adenine37-N6)-methyltransferase
MKDYFQPDFYRFNEDSILLSKEVVESISEAQKLLDIGAGCGVIGLEIAQQIPVEKMILLEAQSEFIPYLQKNVELFLPNKNIEIVNSAVSNFLDSDFDLIVCNPPYYLPGQGRPSKDLRRNIARNFVLDDWEILLNKIKSLLSPKGRAFVIVPSLKTVLSVVLEILLNQHFQIRQIKKKNFYVYELKL